MKDTGIGIPEKDQERVFQGFYPVQDTESYASKRPYSFNAGGKGIDLLRIRMFSELYDFKLSFKSVRCPNIEGAADSWTGETDFCAECKELRECPCGGGSEFVVDFPLAHVSSLAASGRPSKERLQAVN